MIGAETGSRTRDRRINYPALCQLSYLRSGEHNYDLSKNFFACQVSFETLYCQSMKLSIKEVEHIAHLARLGLTDKEKQKFAEQLSAILDYVDQLKEVDTKNVEPTAQVTGLENVMGGDKVENIDRQIRKDLLGQAPETEDDLIKTKAVFE
jgi:aspartyl-tRNA(Asn)/glutamyl-tRNA(Gln) amidotransferase subunit C